MQGEECRGETKRDEQTNRHHLVQNDREDDKRVGKEGKMNHLIENRGVFISCATLPMIWRMRVCSLAARWAVGEVRWGRGKGVKR